MSQFTVDIKHLNRFGNGKGDPWTDRPVKLGFDPNEVKEAQHSWAAQPLGRRLRVIRQFRHLLAENSESLALASASLRQRPVAESLTAEVLPLLDACRFLERQALRLLKARKFSWWSAPLWLGLNRTLRGIGRGNLLSDFPPWLEERRNRNGLATNDMVNASQGRGSSTLPPRRPQ